MEKLRLNIAGMTCVNCSNAIERVAVKIQGVQSAKVSFANGVGEFEILDQSVQETLIAKIKKLGYEVVLDEADFQSRQNEHTAEIFKKFIVSAIISAILMLCEMFFAPSSLVKIFMFALASVSLVYCGGSFFSHAFGALKERNYDMNVLVALGVSSAYIYSMIVSLGIDLFKMPQGTQAHIYLAGPAMIITFVLLGKFLEERSKAKAGEYLKNLLSLAPKTATLLASDGQHVQVQAQDIKIGDIVVVKSGEAIACDGIVVQGGAEIDTAMLTGESLPQYKQQGDDVYTGSLNVNGFICVRAQKLGKNSMISQIAGLLSEASTKKMPISRLADRVANIFVPTVILIAIVTFCYWFFVAKQPGLAFSNAVCVLIISCPCALGLATPIGVICALALGAKHGLLVKNPEILELTNDVKFAVFDKTGTLTHGRLEVLKSTLLPEDLATIASVQVMSEHPIAQAIVKFATRNSFMDKKSEFKLQNCVGLGVIAHGERSVVIGNEKLFEQENIKISAEQKDEILLAQNEGSSVVLCAIDLKFVGFMALSDEPREQAKELIQTLKERKISTMILSGDSQKAVAKVANELGVDSWHSGVLPADKYAKISELLSQGRVLFVGDGINDSPSLKLADIGIAMNSATDLAKSAGDMMLVRNDLGGVAQTLELGRRAMSVIRQNLFWAFCYNAVCIPVAAGAFFGSFGLLLNPAYGALAMCFSSVSVVLNSLRLRTMRL